MWVSLNYEWLSHSEAHEGDATKQPQRLALDIVCPRTELPVTRELSVIWHEDLRHSAQKTHLTYEEVQQEEEKAG